MGDHSSVGIPDSLSRRDAQRPPASVRGPFAATTCRSTEREAGAEPIQKL
jgi:hypothetical protein